ncbi:MAG: hypothetical protein LQ346_008782, partial [Caloplaca aetnensis]
MPPKARKPAAEAKRGIKRRRTGLTGIFTTIKRHPKVQNLDYKSMISFLARKTVDRILLTAALQSPAVSKAIIAHDKYLMNFQTRKKRKYKFHNYRAQRLFADADAMDDRHAWAQSVEVTWAIQESVKTILDRTREHVVWGTKKSAMFTLLDMCKTLLSRQGTVCGKEVCRNFGQSEILESAMLQIAKGMNDLHKLKFEENIGWQRKMKRLMKAGKPLLMFQKI